MPPIIDTEKCIKCGVCADICTMDVFTQYIKDETPCVQYPDECWHCRACVIDCKAKAITIRIPLPYRLLYGDSQSAINTKTCL